MNKARFKKFLSYYRPYIPLLIADLFAASIMAATTLIIPLIIRYIVNDLLPSQPSSLQPVLSLGIAMLGLVALEMVCNFFVTWKGHSMGVRMEKDMRAELFDHLQKLSFSFYDNAKVGSLMSRATSDLFQLVELYHHGPEDIIISLVKFIGAFAILASIHLPLTLIIFALVPFMLIYAWFSNKKLNQGYVRNKETLAKVSAALEDNLNGVRVVQSFANADYENKRFDTISNEYSSAKQHTYFYMAQYFTGMNAMVTLMTVVVAIAGAVFIFNGQLSVGDLLTFTLYISNFTEPIRKVINFAETYQDGMSGFIRFCQIMEIKPDIADRKDATHLNVTHGDIVFEDVSFAYDQNHPVFSHLNLKVDGGTSVALVGSSGVGKTTLCSLLPRFYDPQSGTISIDGQTIDTVTLKSLRENIGIVQQDVYLFNGTVAENIAYGKPTATMDQIIAAAKAANAHDFIMALPHGYDSDIGSHGVKLSGGQKQRLAIARVFLKDPKILIFDEATSALDNESEHYVQQSLSTLALNRTTFIIAHRLSTIRNAKRIIVLGEHGIEEEGDHATLMAKHGAYAKLVEIQYVDAH